MHELDDETKRRLGEIFAVVELWQRRVSDVATRPEAGSSLAGDDAATDPYQMSHSAHLAMASAVDHLNALQSLVRGAQAVHPYASFTILRAAIENASVPLWLLAPAGRQERVLRRLRLQWGDAQDFHNVTGGAPDDLASRKAKLQEVGREAGLSQDAIATIAARPVAYSTIVQIAGEANPDLTGDMALFCWRSCSGMAHAKPWATLSVLEQEQIGEVAAGVLDLRVTASDSNLVTMALAGMLMTNAAWGLIDDRAKRLI
ncbi:hypothetical protein [Pseudonocardia sp. UM4_GMWB1]|uniref:hypothetical protein n=1 Tax=Pseudonocardia sp. UM4_GMWB1 TaxID=2212989 RepID=UPI00307FCE90